LADNNNNLEKQQFSKQQSFIPATSAEDVEFDDEYADADDLEAQQRAAAADQRATARGE
jgi:hypothetical protein